MNRFITRAVSGFVSLVSLVFLALAVKRGTVNKAMAGYAAMMLLSGCSAINPDNELRVTEYGGQGGVVLYGAGELGGCRVVQQGKVDACVMYNGDSCVVMSGACGMLPAATGDAEPAEPADD